MKTIKSILAVGLFLIGSLSLAQQAGRQQGPPPVPNEDQIKEMVNDLTKEITLSDEQETKVLELYKAHFAEVKQQTSGNSRPDREAMEKEKSAFEKKVKAELSKTQIRKYEAFLKKQEPPKKRG